MRREKPYQARDGEGKLESRIAGGEEDVPAPRNEQHGGNGGPKRRSAMENRRGELIHRDGNQGEGESQQKKSGNGEASRSKKSARKGGWVWCILQRHDSFRTSDDTLTDCRPDECRDLGRVAAAKQEVAGQTNQGCPPNSDASHFDRANVTLGRIVAIMIFSHCPQGR